MKKSLKRLNSSRRRSVRDKSKVWGLWDDIKLNLSLHHHHLNSSQHQHHNLFVDWIGCLHNVTITAVHRAYVGTVAFPGGGGDDGCSSDKRDIQSLPNSEIRHASQIIHTHVSSRVEVRGVSNPVVSGEIKSEPWNEIPPNFRKTLKVLLPATQTAERGPLWTTTLIDPNLRNQRALHSLLLVFLCCAGRGGRRPNKSQFTYSLFIWPSSPSFIIYMTNKCESWWGSNCISWTRVLMEYSIHNIKQAHRRCG